jgi:Flavin containing amine oxidoreductase
LPDKRPLGRLHKPRRRFLLGAVGTQLAGCDVIGQQPMPWDKFSLTVNRPGMALGHKLRDLDLSKVALASEKTVDVLIIGSGGAGLTCAWHLKKAGYKNFAILSGPEIHGNAASLSVEGHVCPAGAHYLPLPSIESTAMREILHSMGVLTGSITSDKPSYDERVLVHAPSERVFYQGAWQYGLIPTNVSSQKEKFLEIVATLSKAVGNDGKRAFVVPVAMASSDQRWRQFDSVTFAVWLAGEGFTDPHLLSFLDYCCRDEYGAGIAVVSAWAGLHYFCSRSGHASNAEDGAVLTWPDGLSSIMRFLEADIRNSDAWLNGVALQVRKVGSSVHVVMMADDGTVSLTKARRVVMATPLFVTARIDAELGLAFKDWQQYLPHYQPWVVANFLFKHYLPEAGGADLSWDNIVHQSKGLGFVNAKHQEFNVAASNVKPQLLTAYHAMDELEPMGARRWLAACSDKELLSLVSSDLLKAYGREMWRYLSIAHITVRGHGMPSPRPGYLANKLRSNLGSETGSILYANAELSGYSVFEEAAYWGRLAATRILNAR